jgi:hypothetical protein
MLAIPLQMRHNMLHDFIDRLSVDYSEAYTRFPPGLAAVGELGKG